MAQQEEIIEKRAGSPVMTSCLILSALALIGAVAFNIVEISEVRAKIRPPQALDQENPAQFIRKKDIKEEDDLLNQILALTQGDDAKPFHKEAVENIQEEPAEGAAPKKDTKKAEAQSDQPDKEAKEEPSKEEPAQEESKEDSKEEASPEATEKTEKPEKPEEPAEEGK